jgi:hypothetical protein
MIAVWKYTILFGKERTAAINQVNTWQTVLQGYFLGSEMFFYGERVV